MDRVAPDSAVGRRRRAAKMPANCGRKPVLFEARPDWHEASEYLARRHEYHVRRIVDLQTRSRSVARRMEAAYSALADHIDAEKRFMQAQRVRLDKELVRPRHAHGSCVEHMHVVRACGCASVKIRIAALRRPRCALPPPQW